MAEETTKYLDYEGLKHFLASLKAESTINAIFKDDCLFFPFPSKASFTSETLYIR